MPTEKFTFDGHGGHALAARLDLPDRPHLGVALFAHCFTCSADIKAARRIAGRLVAMGFAVLRFDFTGLGHSDGEFSNTNFSSNVEDLVLAAKALKDRDMPVDLMIGHSLGGAATLKAAAEVPSARAIVTIAAPFDPAHVLKNFDASLDEIRAKGQAKVKLAGRPFTISQSFVDDVSSSALTKAVGGLNKALLVLHSPTDQSVGIENASAIFTAAKHPKSFVTLDGADHLLSVAEDAEYAAEVIAAWVARYLTLPKPAAPVGAPEGVVRVVEADPAGFLQDITAGPNHYISADEPVTYGGTDRGMSPYQLLAAALGACTSMTMRMYARRKGWEVSGISVDVTHARIHASDCTHCDSGEARVDHFNRRIRLEGTLDADQRARLLAIADKCPVHRTLESTSHITTEAEEPLNATP